MFDVITVSTCAASEWGEVVSVGVDVHGVVLISVCFDEDNIRDM